MVDSAIGKLVDYAVRNGLIDSCDRIWAINSILEVMKLDSCTVPAETDGDIDLAAVLDGLCDDAYARGVLAENSVVYRDLFDTALMGRLTPPPHEVRAKFGALLEQDARAATDWYYKLSQDTN